MKLLAAAAATALLYAIGPATLVAQSSAESDETTPAAASSGRIGYVDIDKITSKAKQSAAMDKLSEDVRRIQKEFQGKLDKQRELEREIEKSRGVVSADETSRKQREVNRLKNEIEELELSYKRELQKIDDTLFTPLVKQIGYSIEDVAKERGFDIVLRGEAVFYGSPAVDLTDDVIAKLDLESVAAGSLAKGASKSAEKKPAPKAADAPAAFRPAPAKETPSSSAGKAPRIRPVDRQTE